MLCQARTRLSISRKLKHNFHLHDSSTILAS